MPVLDVKYAPAPRNGQARQSGGSPDETITTPHIGRVVEVTAAMLGRSYIRANVTADGPLIHVTVKDATPIRHACTAIDVHANWTVTDLGAYLIATTGRDGLAVIVTAPPAAGDRVTVGDVVTYRPMDATKVHDSMRPYLGATGVVQAVDRETGDTATVQLDNPPRGTEGTWEFTAPADDLQVRDECAGLDIDRLEPCTDLADDEDGLCRNCRDGVRAGIVEVTG